MVNFRIFAEVSTNGSDPGPCSALREDGRRAGSPGERPVALAGEGRRTAHKSGCTHLAAGVGVSRGAPEGAVSGGRRSAAHSEPDRGGGSRSTAAHVRPRMVHARAQRRRAGAVDRRTAGRTRHPAAGSGLCALFPPRPGSYCRHQRGAGRKAPARAGGGILLVVPRQPALHLAQTVDRRAAGALLVPREPHRAGEPLLRPLR